MKIALKFIFASILFLAMISSDAMCEEPTRSAPQSRRRASANRPQNAPKIVPGTTAEMQTPEFWISRIDNPDRVIMTPEQIKDLNEKNKKRGTQFTDIFGDPYSIDNVIKRKDRDGLTYHVQDPLACMTFPADSIRNRLDRQNGWIKNGRLYDRRNMQFDDDMRQELIDMTDVGSIPGNIIKPLYGIVVKHTNGRKAPQELKANGGPGGWLDAFQSGMIDFGQPVAILHVSKDRDWYYVMSEISIAWVPASHVALGSPGEIREYIDSNNFIVAACHKVPIYGDSNFNNFIVDFYMGAKVMLIQKTSEGYKVRFPYRKPDGTFGTAVGWVKPDARVSEGYQQFTQRNIINTVFTLLYRPYGWADSYNERDCCGMVRVILRTSGIFTGRWTSFELHSFDHVYMLPRKTSKEKKYELLGNCESGLCLVGDGGHISMYLGEVDNRHYVIHQSGYSYTDEDGTRMNVNRVNVNDTEFSGGSNIGGWTEITEMKP